VTLNLIGNALAATGAGGTIRTAVRPEDSRVVLTIEDDGQGIAPADLPKVFDPFFSRTEGGTGLGLSIVHGIVGRHRGSVGITSRLGRGTTVRVELPAWASEEDDE
jgi:signal transduction histidine kinase